MSSKLDELIKKLKIAKEAIEKGDDVSLERVKEIMRTKLKADPGAGKKIADHYRDIDETIPAKQRSNIKNSLKTQEAKLNAVKQLKAVPAPKPEATITPIKKSATEIADELIKSLKGIGGLSKDEVNTLSQRRPAGAKVKDHMDWLGSFKGGAGVSRYAKTVKGEEAIDGDSDDAYKSKVKKSDEQKSMDLLTKRFGAMMPKQNLQPSNEEFEAEMVRRGMVVTQEQAEALEKGYSTGINDWFAEAAKPISARFASTEEEEAYWANIKVNGGSDNGPGY